MDHNSPLPHNGNDCSPKESPTTEYYGIYLSPDTKNVDIEEGSLVLTERIEAVKIVKKYKRARFKRFTSYEAAYDFVRNGSDQQGGVDVTPTVVNNERLIPHKAPRPQELVKLRKSIESGDILTVQMMINENPRFLISSGDTPSILQEGSRYNALHCAAKARTAVIASYILETISSVNFMKKLYGITESESLEGLHERCTVLVDLFLNTPDKSLNETPLHFASKFGALDVVEVLISYPQCKRKQGNKFHQTPSDIVCSRACAEALNHKKKIMLALADCHYVPVLRSIDPSVQGVVGEPFTLQQNPVLFSSNEMMPYDVKAVAGPMDEPSAVGFRKQWKANCKLPKYQSKVFNDPQKGLECVGRELATISGVQWTEYWPFLDLFVDLRNQQGLYLLEEFLKKRFKQSASSFLTIQEPSSNTPQVMCQRGTPLGYQSPLGDRKITKCSRSNASNVKQFSNAVAKFSIPSEITPMNPFVQVERMCQEFSRRLIRTILSHSKKGIYNEVAHIQNYISSCADDVRFKTIELSKIHCRLGGICYMKLTASEKDTALDSLKSVLNQNEMQLTPTSTSAPVNCILNILYTHLNEDSISDIRIDLEDWLNEKPCSCPVLSNRKCGNLRRSLFHHSDDTTQIFEAISTVCLNDSESDDSSGNEPDTDSDSESLCYYTPPTSPLDRIFDYSSSDDECLMTPEEGPDIFIMGDKLTKIDSAVLEAISDVHLDPLKYSNIIRWKHLCDHFHKLPSESWPSSPSHLSSPKCQVSSSPFSPPWHPSKLLLHHIKKN